MEPASSAVVLYQPEIPEPNVEQDPEVIALKTQLRKAQVQRQIREAQAPLDVQTKLREVLTEPQELRSAVLDDEGSSYVDELYADVARLDALLEKTPLVGLKDKFTCKRCGASGLVAVTPGVPASINAQRRVCRPEPAASAIAPPERRRGPPGRKPCPCQRR